VILSFTWKITPICYSLKTVHENEEVPTPRLSVSPMKGCQFAGLKLWRKKGIPQKKTAHETIVAALLFLAKAFSGRVFPLVLRRRVLPSIYPSFSACTIQPPRRGLSPTASTGISSRIPVSFSCWLSSTASPSRIHCKILWAARIQSRSPRPPQQKHRPFAPLPLQPPLRLKPARFATHRAKQSFRTRGVKQSVSFHL